MSVSNPRAYAAYARDVAAGAASSGSAVDSRRLRAGVAVAFRLAVCLGQLAHQLVAPIVQASEPPLLAPGERVRGDEWEADTVMHGASHRRPELLGVDLAPAHRSGACRPRQPARLGARPGARPVVGVALL